MLKFNELTEMTSVGDSRELLQTLWFNESGIY